MAFAFAHSRLCNPFVQSIGCGCLRAQMVPCFGSGYVKRKRAAVATQRAAVATIARDGFIALAVGRMTQDDGRPPEGRLTFGLRNISSRRCMPHYGLPLLISCLTDMKDFGLLSRATAQIQARTDVISIVCPTLPRSHRLNARRIWC